MGVAFAVQVQHLAIAEQFAILLPLQDFLFVRNNALLSPFALNLEVKLLHKLVNLLRGLVLTD